VKTAPGLLVDASMTLAGPAGTFRLAGSGRRLVLDATSARWVPLVRAGAGRRERRWLRTVTRALEARDLRVDVEKGGRRLLSMGAGCGGGVLSWLLGGAAVAFGARA
jgi:hypothetical protein